MLLTIILSMLKWESIRFRTIRSVIFAPFFFFIFLVVCGPVLFAQEPINLSPEELKKMSINDLMEMEVTSVSKRPEKLNEAASAIQVISQEDIRSSGATSIPEALRLATNLQVAQVNSSQWAISARGFNNVLSNKLLVMIDGRVVYTPMYAGVFWDVQNLVLADVDHIEVVSGPGGTLWGANAVNGVINIITKKAGDTKGLLVEAAAGTELLRLCNLRYGGKVGDKFSYRVYGTTFKRDNTILKADSTNAHDAWTMTQGGFRFDWDVTKKDNVSLQSNFYYGEPDPDGNKLVIAMGGNMIGLWNHTISATSDYRIQAYFDQTWRDFRNDFAENLRTYDLDGQHRFQLGSRNEIVWGGGVRIMDHKVDTLPLFGFIPPRKTLHIYSAFVQDKIILIKGRLSCTVGSKFEHNNYVGFQYQPSARIALTPGKKQTIWAAVSRAIRTPSRLDREFMVSLFPGFPVIKGDSTFKTEELLAYELGWRIQPVDGLVISLSTFYNLYDNIRSAEPGTGPLNYPITFGNGVRGESYGAELSAAYPLTWWWHLRGGYTIFDKNLWVKEGSKDLNKATAESNDPQNQFLIQSTLKLPLQFELGTVVRYIDYLPKPKVIGYTGLDVRLGWKFGKTLELNLVGQNLLQESHMEFIPASPSARRIQRSVYGKVTVKI